MIYIAVLSQTFSHDNTVKIAGAWNSERMAKAYKDQFYKDCFGEPFNFCEIVEVEENKIVLVEEASGFKKGDEVTWKQDFQSRQNPPTQEGVVEEVYLCCNCESGIGLKVSFYNGILDSNWIKKIE